MEPEARRICYFRAGETGELLGGDHIKHPDGNVYRLSDCTFEADASVHLEEPEHMDPVALPVPAPEAPPPAAEPVATPAPTPVEATASVAVPDPTTAASELQGLVGAAGGDSTLAIALAAIAVLGGGAAWKFYSQQTKQSHELKMKELEMKSQAPSQSPPPCILKHGEIETRLQGLEATVDLVAKRSKASALPAGFDAEELEERVVKLEKAAKAKGKV